MRLRKEIKIILFVIVMFIASFIIIKRVSYVSYTKIDNRDIYFKEKEVEVYNKVSIKDFIDIDNGYLEEDLVINTLKIGKQKIEIRYLKEEKGYITEIEIDVYDAKPPYVGLNGSYTHTIREELKIDGRVFAGDNYSSKLKKEIIGNYDLNKEGNYSVKYKVSDESENFTIKDFTLKVVKPRPSTGGNSNNKSQPKVVLIPFSTIVKNTPANASLMIDVSKWQGKIDWKKVRESGIEYAMLRIGTQKKVDDTSVIDQYFETNYNEAKKYGVKLGVYYFSYARNIKDAKEQAAWVIKTLNGRKLDLPVSYDWETWNIFNYLNISFYELNEIARTFMKDIEESGYKAMNYGSKFYLELVWDIPEYPTWLAHYTSNTTYSKDYLIWQFTSKGEIPGINGGVDVNYFYNKD